MLVPSMLRMMYIMSLCIKNNVLSENDMHISLAKEVTLFFRELVTELFSLSQNPTIACVISSDHHHIRYRER